MPGLGKFYNGYAGGAERGLELSFVTNYKPRSIRKPAQDGFYLW
jgi:hypothetical protein